MVSFTKLAVALLTTIPLIDAGTYPEKQFGEGYITGENSPPPNYGDPHHIRCDDNPVAEINDLQKFYDMAKEGRFMVNYLSCRGRRPSECTRFRAYRHYSAGVYIAGRAKYNFHERDYTYYMDRIIEACAKDGPDGKRLVGGSMWLDKRNTGSEGSWIYIGSDNIALWKNYKWDGDVATG